MLFRFIPLSSRGMLLSIIAIIFGVVAGSRPAMAQEEPAASSSDAVKVLKWKTVVNIADSIPGTQTPFSSFNQPSINNNGLVAFRARSKGPSQPIRGIFVRNVTRPKAPITTIADTNSTVPAPNNTGATFNEMPAFPRIPIGSGAVAFRGVSEPVYEYTLPDGTDTKIGTSGVYMVNVFQKKTLITAASQLGVAPGFEYFQVPGASVANTKFDQFPGAPSPTYGAIVFKGNYTDNGVSKTGVYYRKIRNMKNPRAVVLIANSDTVIPNQSNTEITFGSTAPPSSYGLNMVFLGVDNEDAPTMGGIYLSKLVEQPKLKPLVPLGTPVPGIEGETINRLGEAISFNDHYIAYWGAWGTATQTVTLTCPTDGNADLIQYCNQQYPGGVTTVEEPANQGIFITNILTKKTKLVAATGADNFVDFLYWTYSGRPPGSSDSDDFEPPRWRSAAFAAVYGQKTAFKGTKADGTVGVYLGNGAKPSLDTHQTIVDTTTDGTTIDPEAPSGVSVTAVGIERDGFRNGRLAINASMANADATLTWAGIYVTRP